MNDHKQRFNTSGRGAGINKIENALSTVRLALVEIEQQIHSCLGRVNANQRTAFNSFA